jgi:hypothetical protein
MKLRYKICITLLLFANLATAGSNLIFDNGFEPLFGLNDTGITFSGNISSGNDLICENTTPQDCHAGRDSTHNDSSDWQTIDNKTNTTISW